MAPKNRISLLTIGDVAAATGVSTDTLRYYEKMHLLIACERSPSGYRLYAPEAVRVVQFIRGAKSLHFTLDEIRQLLALNASDQSTCAEMIARTKRKIHEAEMKINELKAMKTLLTRLVKTCPGDASKLSACPIIDHIKAGKPLVQKKTSRARGALAALVVLCSFSLPHDATAKPISYAGGTMVMLESDQSGTSLEVDYTVTPSYAVGLMARKERGNADDLTVGPQLNLLLNRWNLPDGQGNLYATGGGGVTRRDGNSDPAAWASIQGDFETRRIFTLLELNAVTSDIETTFTQRARVGVAPYIGNYDEVNPWLMLQADHQPDDADSFVLTPLVRMFYGTNLVEFGYSSNHHVLLNFTKQF
jgi:DNA-binding transcriptional MerR regulator